MKLIFLILLFNSSLVESSSLNIKSFFSNCRIRKNYIYISKEELEKLQALNQQRVIRRFKIDCQKENLVGFVFSDKVRTHFQQLLVILREDKIYKMEILKFNEPAKYRPPQKWLEYVFKDKNINTLKIDGRTGATLTTNSIRRVFEKVKILKDYE